MLTISESEDTHFLLLCNALLIFCMKTEFDKYIINRVREIRKERGHTQRDIADFIHRSPAFVGQVESDKFSTKYTVFQLYQLSLELDFKFEDIFPSKDWEPSHATDSE